MSHNALDRGDSRYLYISIYLHTYTCISIFIHIYRCTYIYICVFKSPPRAICLEAEGSLAHINGLNAMFYYTLLLRKFNDALICWILCPCLCHTMFRSYFSASWNKALSEYSPSAICALGAWHEVWWWPTATTPVAAGCALSVKYHAQLIAFKMSISSSASKIKGRFWPLSSCSPFLYSMMSHHFTKWNMKPLSFAFVEHSDTVVVNATEESS